MKRILAIAAFGWVMALGGSALAQTTYPPSEPPPTDPPIVCVDCDTADTGGDIALPAAIGAGLLAIGATATVIARRKTTDG